MSCNNFRGVVQALFLFWGPKFFIREAKLAKRGHSPRLLEILDLTLKPGSRFQVLASMVHRFLEQAMV